MLSENIKDFLYLDSDGIDLLHSQTVDRVEVSYSETSNHALTGKVGVAGKLKSAFLGFLGQGELSGTSEVSGSKGTAHTTLRETSVPSKLKSLVSILQQLDYGVCFSSLGAAADYALTNSQKVFFCGKHEFDAPQFIVVNGAMQVTESGYLLLQSGQANHHDESDSYYKHPKFKATMSCSVRKMPRCSGDAMPITGHDAVYFRGFGGVRVPLNVFCSVVPMREFVQLKPYAIWV